jgi:hypothetical protein
MESIWGKAEMLLQRIGRSPNGQALKGGKLKTRMWPQKGAEVAKKGRKMLKAGRREGRNWPQKGAKVAKRR